MLGFFFSFFFSFLYVSFLGFSWGQLFSCVFFFLFFFFFFDYGWFSIYGLFFLDVTSVLLISLSFFITYLMYVASLRVNIMDFFSDYFSFFVFFLCFIVFLCFSSSNFFFFFVFFEFSLMPTLLLILGWGYQPERLQAGYYMIIYTIFASLPFLMLFVFFSFNFGSFFIFFFWDFCFSLIDSFIFFFIFFFSVFAFIVKLPVYGFHLWLPKAHVEAPVSGSMILAGVLLKLGGYGLFRVFFFFGYFFPFFGVFMFSFIMWGGLLASFICFRQIDLKGLVAYSSVGHMAVLFSGYYVGSFFSVSGALMMMVGHGLCSSCLFVLASLGYDLFGSRSVYFVKGMMIVYPSLVFWWFVFCSGNMAVPPSLNLCSEILVLIGVLGYGFFFFIIIGFMMFFVGGYSLYLFLSFSHGSLLDGCSFFLYSIVNSFLIYVLHFIPFFFSFLFCDIFFFCKWFYMYSYFFS